MLAGARSRVPLREPAGIRPSTTAKEMVVSDELNIETELTSEVVAEDVEEYEEITSEEVDRVVESLERLIESVQSENVRSYLEDAMNGVYYLIYEDEEEEDAMAEAA